jgi:hypothetical protein
LLVYSPNNILHRVHFRLFKIDLAALRANPRRNIVKAKVNILTIDVKGRMPTHHFTLTVDALHGFTRVRDDKFFVLFVCFVVRMPNSL